MRDKGILCNKVPQNLATFYKLFNYVHRFCGSGIQKGHSKNGLYLVHDVWGLSCENSKAGVIHQLGAEII